VISKSERASQRLGKVSHALTSSGANLLNFRDMQRVCVERSSLCAGGLTRPQPWPESSPERASPDPVKPEPCSRGWRGAPLALLFLALRPDLPRALGRRLFGWRAWHERAARPRWPAPFSHLAASQVGYGPRMQKEFTSPAPFQSFRVVDVQDGKTVLSDTAPPRALSVQGLGAVQRGSVPQRADCPGRYRIVASNGQESYPFEI
jgi:hypothetical protein